MNYPLISEYIEAIKAAEDNFEKLKNRRPVLDEDGNPAFSSGNFAVVFKMKDEQTGKMHAVKCFLKEQEGRIEAYRQIAEELEYVSSTFLTPIKYLDKELFVDSSNSEDSEFPVLLMDWVEGQTLDKYIREHIDDQYELSLLAYQFSRLAMWLMPQPFAHGDLKPDNILVKEDGTLVLVDYDGMYVPTMKGQKARELGSPDFRHPSRTEDVFDEHIDDFSLVSILLSLKAISLQPDLLKQYGASDRLLFSERDYRDITQCKLLNEIFPSQNPEMNLLIGLFMLAHSYNNLSCSPNKLVYLQKPHKKQSRNFVLENSDDYIDEFGVHFSNDKTILIGAVDDWLFDVVYAIPEGTEIIRGGAFARNESEQWFQPNRLKCIVIPSSVRIIDSLPGKYQIKCDSPYFKWYKNGLYTSDFKNLVYYPFIKETHEIFLHPFTEKLSFGYGDYGEVAHPESCYEWQYHYYPTTILYQYVPNVKFELSENTVLCVPKGTIELFLNLGYESKQVIEGCVYIDDYGVVYSDDRKELIAFPFNSSLEKYEVLEQCEIIRDNAFKKWLFQINFSNEDDDIYIINQLRSLTLSNKLIEIGNDVFQGCHYLMTIKLPKTLIKIGEGAFDGCSSLAAIYVPLGEKEKFQEFLPNYSNIIIECLDKKIDYDSDIEKKKQIEEAYKELEQQWDAEYEQNSGFYEELDEPFFYDDDSFEKEKLIRRLLDYEKIGMKPKKEVNGNSSIEDLQDAVDELDNASWMSWEEDERKYSEKIESNSKPYMRQPDVNEEDIMRAISEGYGDIYGY